MEQAGTSRTEQAGTIVRRSRLEPSGMEQVGTSGTKQAETSGKGQAGTIVGRSRLGRSRMIRIMVEKCYTV